MRVFTEFDSLFTTTAMAIAVIVSSLAESDRFVAVGLDLATRLESAVVFLCIRPDGDGEKNKQDKGNLTQKPVSKKEPKVTGTPGKSPIAFRAAKPYVDETRVHVVKHLATMKYGFVKHDVIEVPGNVDQIRRWLTERHYSDQLGRFSVETVFIPTLRGAGLEHARATKDHLFDSSSLETVYLCVDQSRGGRLPFAEIGVCGGDDADVLNASRFARQFVAARVTRCESGQRNLEQRCVIGALPGKANQTRVDGSALWRTLRKDNSLPVAMMLNPVDTRVERFNAAIDDKIRDWFHAYQLSREDRIRLSEKLQRGAESSPEFILFMAVATFLACIGLIQDSAAVIIGAMLVAPLMTPLLGAGMAMIFGNRPLFGKAVRSILLGVAIAFLIGATVGLVSLCVPSYMMSGNGLSLTNEMISRSQPNLMDPFIGLAAGLAGGFAIGRDGQIGTVAGVAIAAALVPPIGTAGLEASLAIYCAIQDADPLTFFRLLNRDPSAILSEHGLLAATAKSTQHTRMIAAPLILFVLNACATIIGAFVGLRLVGMHRTSRARQSRKWVYVFLIGLLAIILSLMILPLLI